MKSLIKTTFNVVAASVVLFSIIAIFVAMSTSSMMVSEAERTVRSVVKATTGRIDRLMTGVESAVANSVWIVGEHLNDPDYMYKLTRELVDNNEYIVGSTVAFEPFYFKDRGKYFAPYTCDEGGGKLKSFQLGNDSNRYHEQDWYADAKKAGHAIWSEPYFDEGGAKILMSTYSMPVKDASGKIFAVLTADLSLEQLTRHVASICPYPQSYAVMQSAAGANIVEPPKDARPDGDGKTITIRDKADNGWSVEIVCPVSEILRGAQQLVIRIIIFSVAGLGLIFLLSWFYSSRLQRVTATRERMESELATARVIQSNILPKDFPENVSAALRPAREVGGDLYDFVRKDDKLYFIIGDASGKGVPAALFSFIAGTVFRMACTLGLQPSEIVERINEALVRGNDMCMFVTTFVGVLDLPTGSLDYACAGHNPPVVVTPDGQAAFLPVKRNIPAGAMEGRAYVQQTTVVQPGSRIVVYTDGVTEAERLDKMQFGDDRLKSYLAAHAQADAKALVEGLLREVDGFVAGAEQSDDITIMAIRC